MLLHLSILVLVACISTLRVINGSKIVKISLETSHRNGGISLNNLQKDAIEMQRLLKRGEEPMYNIDNLYYQGEISMGTPPQRFNASFSTGMADLLVMDKALCHTAEWTTRCAQHNEYNCKKSSTCKNTGKKFSIYDNMISGTVIKENVTVANVTVQNVKFGAMKNLSEGSGVIGYRAYDAIVGLAYPKALQIKGVEPLLMVMHKQGQVKDPVFSFHFSNCSSGCTENTLVLGGLDDKHCTGSVIYTNVTEKKLFTVKIDGAKLDSQSVIPRINSILLAGIVLMYGPKTYMYEINNIIGAKQSGYLWMVDCNKIHTMPMFTWIISGTTFEMKPEDYILRMQPTTCISAFVGFENLNHLILGYPFFRSFPCTVFDLGKDMVGFARTT